MNSLDRYILKQCLVPFLLAMFIVTTIVWMTQSLQRADILIEYSQGLGVFVWLSLLIVPSLLAVILPFSLFAAALYTLQRLHADSEIAVMFAAGVSRLRIGAPFLLIALAGALATLWVNLDLMPRSYRIMKREVADIRADFAAAVIRGGEFTTLANGFTVYVEEVRPGGQLIGLLINDYRRSGAAETYMAQRGLLRETPQGPVLYLINGNVQRVARYTGVVEFVRFEETAINLASFDKRGAELQLELTERYLGELFKPDLSRAWDRDNARLLRAEGHNRLAAPLYAFAYVLIALYALIGGAYTRRGYSLRVAGACAGAGLTRIGGFVLQSAAAQTGAYWLIYAPPVAVICVLAFMLVDRSRGARPRRPHNAVAARLA